MILVIEANKTLHTIVLVECPLQLPVIILKPTERVVYLAIKCI